MDVPSAQVGELMDSVLTLVWRPEAAFAREFFFNGFDISANLSIITNPSALAYATMTNSSCNTSAMAHSPPAAHQIAPMTMNKSFVLVPCFSASNISIGACVAKAQGEIFGRPEHHLNEISVGRFVRDEATSETLFLVQTVNSTAEITIILGCFRHMSPTSHEHVSFLCVPQPFLAGSRADSVRAVFYARESRNCPVCGKFAVMSCSCTLPMTALKHPMDFEAIASNMATHYHRRWAGVATSIFRKNVLDPSEALVGVDLHWSHSFMASTDLSLFAQLRERIIQTSMSTVAPARSIISVIETVVSDIIEDRADEHPGANPRAISCYRSPRLDHNVPEVRKNGAIDAVFRPAPRIPSAKVSGYADDLTSRSPSIGAMAWHFPQGSSAPPTIERNSQSCDKSGEKIRRSSGQYDQSSEDPSSGHSTDYPVDGLHDAMNPSQKKALDRKEKNRAAAARSNAKRKERLLKLREDVTHIRRRFADLSKRERALRQQNLSLRADVKGLSL